MKEYNLEYIEKMRIHELRDYARKMGISSPTTRKKDELIDLINQVLNSQNVDNANAEDCGVDSLNTANLDFFALLSSKNSQILNDLIYNSNKVSKKIAKDEPVEDKKTKTLVMTRSTVGNEDTYYYSNNEFVGFNFTLNQNQAIYNSDVSTVQGFLDIHPNGYGIIRADGFLPSDFDVYLTQSLIKEYNLKKGNLVKGKAKYILENKPKVMFSIVSVDGSDDDKKMAQFDQYPYNKCSSKHFLEKFNLSIHHGERLYLKNMSLDDVVRLSYDLVDSNPVNVKLINLKARPEDVIKSHQKFQAINCTFDRSEVEIFDTVELVLERIKREFEDKKSNILIIYNFRDLIRTYSAALEGAYELNRFNAKAINKIVKILCVAKAVDNNLNSSVICIDNNNAKDDLGMIIDTEFMPLFNNVIEL